MRWLPNNYPTREGWYYLAMAGFVFTGSILREINLMLLVGGIMLGPLVFAALNARKILRGLTIRRTLPRGVHAGQECAVEYAVTCAVSTRGVTLTEDFSHSDAPHAPRKLAIPLSTLTKPGSVLVAQSIRPPRRGVYRFAGIWANTIAPFGLWCWWRRMTENPTQPTSAQRPQSAGSFAAKELSSKAGESWLVWPALLKFNARLAGLGNWLAAESAARQGTTRPAAQGEFAGLRAWRRGDLRRDIHWRSSARRGELLVKHYDHQPAPIWSLAVELWQPELASALDLLRVEQAVSMIATLVAELQSRQQRLVFFTLGTELRVFDEAAGRAGDARIMDYLALVAASQKTRGLALPDGQLLPRDPPGQMLFLTTRPLSESHDPANNAAQNGSANHAANGALNGSANAAVPVLATASVNGRTNSANATWPARLQTLWPRCRIHARSVDDPNWQRAFSTTESSMAISTGRSTTFAPATNFPPAAARGGRR